MTAQILPFPRPPRATDVAGDLPADTKLTLRVQLAPAPIEDYRPPLCGHWRCANEWYATGRVRCGK